MRLVTFASLVRRILPLTLVLGERVLRNLKRHVWDGERQIEEKRLVLVCRDEAERLLLEEIVCVLLPSRAVGIARQLDLLAIAIDEFGIMVVRVTLAVVAEESI